MNIWQKKSFLTWLLAPLSLLFYLISGLRKRLYLHHILPSYRAPIPVLVVGNLSVGGNGKTPAVIWLVEQLQQHGIKVGVISRGYGGQNKQFPQLVHANSLPCELGDEPVLIAQRTNAPVAVSPNRRESIELLLRHYKLDLIITDDGLQHYALQRDWEWVVIDGERRFGNGFLLPAGGLRELPSRLKSVQAVICNGKNAKDGEHSMQLSTAFAINLSTNEKCLLSELTNKNTIAMAGIGHPPRFFTMLKQLGFHLKQCHPFADHQSYRAEQLMTLAQSNEILLMTEKDAVKCRTFAQKNWWYVPVSAQFSENSTTCLLAPILNLVRNNNERKITD